MDLQLTDKLVLVTGGSRGLGFACAKTLVEEGARVALVSRNKDNLEKAAANLDKISDHPVAHFACDLQNPDDISALGNWVRQQFEQIDGLLLNAGGPPAGGALAFDDETWQNAVDTLLTSVVRLTRLFVPMMREKKFGRIVAIESSSVKQSIPNLALSNTVRPAVVAYLKTLSAEVASDNILMNTVLPGPTKTERLESLLQNWAKNANKSVDAVRKEREAQIPVGRFGEPEELAAIATFLLSPKNSYISGQSIAVDGGFMKTVF